MRLQIGIVGTGVISTSMHIPVLRAMSSVSIRWVADADESRAKEVGKINRLAAVPLNTNYSSLPAVDIVLLAIPLPPRRQYLEFFANRNTAVLLEKPLALNTDEHRKMMASYEAWQLSVGYQRRYYATSQLLRKLIRSDVFGIPKKIVISEGGRTTRSGASSPYQDAPASQGGGIVKNLGCHSIDLAFWLTSAMRARVIDRSVQWDRDTDRACQAHVRLQGMNGIAGLDCDLHWDLSWLESRQNTLEVHFETAVLRCPISPAADVQLCDAMGNQFASLDASRTRGALTSTQAFYLEWCDVVRAVQTRTEQSVSPWNMIATTELIDELLER